MISMRKNFRFNVIIQAAAIMVLILSVYSCGRKGPPVPPHQKEVPAVNNLESILEGDNVVLLWVIPSGKAKKRS